MSLLPPSEKADCLLLGSLLETQLPRVHERCENHSLKTLFHFSPSQSVIISPPLSQWSLSLGRRGGACRCVRQLLIFPGHLFFPMTWWIQGFSLCSTTELYLKSASWILWKFFSHSQRQWRYVTLPKVICLCYWDSFKCGLFFFFRMRRSLE